MTENQQPPADKANRGQKFFVLFKKINKLWRREEQPVVKEETTAEKSIDEMQVEGLNSRRLPSWKQLKYLPRFMSAKEKNVMRLAVTVLVICAFLLSYFVVSGQLVDKPARGGIYTEELIGTPQNINPLYAQSNEVDQDLARLIFAGLVRENSQGELVPDLAKEWFVDETQTKYTFKLRDDVEWSDGEKFTSQDVIFTIEALQNPLYQSPSRTSWIGIGAEALDDYTVQFSLPAAYGDLLQNLTVGILPAHLWQEILPENATLAELNLKPMGLGPYQFDSFVKDKQGYIKSYTLNSNENYHGSLPYLEQITLKFQPTFEAAVEALKNKNADGLSYLPQSLKGELESRKDLNYYSVPLPQYTAIFFNQTKNSALAEKKVRQALELSINKTKIVQEILANEATVINGPLLPGMPGYEESAEPFDTEAAKKLLADAGWQKKEIKPEENQATSTEDAIETDSNGWSKFLFKNNQELTIQLTSTDQAQSLAIAELIQKYWQSIGVKVNLNAVEVSKIQKEVISERNFEALMFGEILDQDWNLYPFWHSSAATNEGLNIANFKNDKADKLLTEIQKINKDEERAPKLKELQKIIRDEAPAIWLYNPRYTYAIADRIKGINLTRIVSPTDRLNGMTDWYIKTKKGFK